MAGIILVKIDRNCYDGDPCKHYVTVEYTNGQRERRLMSGEEIWDNFKQFLENDEYFHFQRYE